MELALEKWQGKVSVVTLGRESGKSVKIGGEESLPFLFQEAKLPHKPLIAYEIWDIFPADWPQELLKSLGPETKDPLVWAQKCAGQFKAQALCLKLQGAHPDLGDKKPQEEAKLVSRILESVELPLIITGCGDDAKDNLILPACSEAARGSRCLIGNAVQDNYKTLAAALTADGHNIIAESPIDVNIAKQLNILISDMGLPLERIVMNPTIGALGYGLEYAYSIMERARLAALAGDKTLGAPFICFVGQESWRAKEARASGAEFPSWGEESCRGIAWEIATSGALLHSGADILVMRHPEAIRQVSKYIEEMYAL